MERTENRKLELDDCYKESEILELGLKLVEVTKMNYIIYEDEDEAKIYYFEQLENNMLRLYCQTNKQSFYL